MRQLTATQISLIALAAVMVIAVVGWARPLVRRQARVPAWAWAVAALLAAAGVLRAALAAPSFLHAGTQGSELLDQIYRFPAPAMAHADYGQASFLLLGALTRVLGQRFEVIALANQALALLTLGVMAAVAVRWTGRPLAALCVIALGALHPALIRVAASEDAHNLAVLLGWVGILAFDVAAERRNRWALIAGVASLALMVHTRQTSYLWVAGPVAIGLVRAGPNLRGRRDLLLASAIVLVVAAVPVVRTMLAVSRSAPIIAVILSDPLTVARLFRYHTLLDVPRFGPFIPLLLAVGVRTLWVELRPVGRPFVLLLLGFFLLTLPYGPPTPSVELLFRLPLHTLGIFGAAIGADKILSLLAARLARPAARRAVLGGAMALTAAFYVPLSGWRAVTTVSAAYREYVALPGMLERLPPQSYILAVPPNGKQPRHDFPHHLLRTGTREARIRSSHDLRPGDLDGIPVLFFTGVRCWGYGVTHVSSWKMGSPDRAAFRAEADARFGRGPIALPVPAEMRPECKHIVANSVPIGPAVILDNPEPDIPFIIFGRPQIPLQFYKLVSFPGGAAAPAP